MARVKVSPALGDSSDGKDTFLERLCPWMKDPVLRRLQPKGMPLLYGKEDLEMGESTVHTITAAILFHGLGFHFARLAGYQVFSNLNLCYSTEDPTQYVSPDVMVVRPPRALPVQLNSYHLGEQGPAPVLIAEVLSFRTWQQGDLGCKPMLYSRLGVKEYLLADVTGEMLEGRLLLLGRQRDGSWQEEQDEDGGITSRLGFRVVLEADGQLRVIDAKTGKHYARPDEAQAMADKVHALEEELARLRRTSPHDEPESKKGKGRRRKS